MTHEEIAKLAERIAESEWPVDTYGEPASQRCVARLLPILAAHLAAREAEYARLREAAGPFKVGDKVVFHTSMTYGDRGERPFTILEVRRMLRVQHPDGHQLMGWSEESHLVKVEDIPEALEVYKSKLAALTPQQEQGK